MQKKIKKLKFNITKSAIITSNNKNSWLEEGKCLICGDSGYWQTLALLCPKHGRII